MACRESGGSKVLLCVGLLVALSSFCHCASLMRPRALGKSRDSSTLSHGQTKGNGQRHGKLLIGAKHKGTKATEKLLDVDSDYQGDMDTAAVDKLLQMEPKVECTADSMQLHVRNAAFTPGSLFFVDRGSHLSPLPLSKLPSSCGYTIRATPRDLVLVAPYDGCFVAFEKDSYVLPLRWCGLTVRMSCPLRQSSPDPPMVTCHAEGMVVKTEWTDSVSKIKVKLNGNWEPLMKASSSCGFGVVVHPQGVVIAVHYAPCLEKKDGMYTLELAGDGETKISCPSLSPAQPEPSTKSPAPTQGPYQSPKLQKPTVPQDPGLPQKPGVPEQPTQRPKDIGQPQLPYYNLYPYYFYPYFPNPDTVQPIPTSSPVIKTTTSQTKQPHDPLPFYVQSPQPGTLSTQPPLTVLPVKQPASLPEGQDQILPYPFVFYPQPLAPELPKAEQPHEKPVPSKPPLPKKIPGQTYNPFYSGPFYQGHLPYAHYQMPIPLKQQSPTLAPRPDTTHGPSPTYMQQPQQVTNPASNTKTTGSAILQPSYFVAPPELPHMPLMYCPQVCPSGFSNCCPQIAFHQYLHIVPAGFGSKDTLPSYSPLPFPHSVAYSGFGSDLSSAPFLLVPAETMTTQGTTLSTSASISQQPRASGNRNHLYLQPPDGNPAPLPRSNPSKPKNSYVPNLQYHNWPYLSENEELSESQSPTHYNTLSEHHILANNQVNQVQRFEQNPVLFPGEKNNPPSPNFVYDPNHNHQQQNKATTRKLEPSNTQVRKPPALDHSLFTYMLQEPQTEYSKPVVPNSSQPEPLENGSKTYTEDEETAESYSEPKSYVLLPHGPPGGDPHSWNKSPLPFRDLVMAQNPARHHSSKLQQFDWLGKSQSDLLPGSVNYMPKSGDESEGLPLYDLASNGPHFVDLPQDHYFSASHLKPQFSESFEDLKSMIPPGSSQQIPPYVAGETFKPWSSAFDLQVNGPNKPIQREDGK